MPPMAHSESDAGPAAAGSSGGSRFAHLLKPIRDLAENWQIDIAHELQSFLDEIVDLKFAFEGSGETFSFAEAALLIQGTACVYAKKVEMLYKLVYQTLDLLARKRQPKVGSSMDEDGNDKDVADLMAADKEDEFLPLDNLKEEKNIDIVNERPPVAVAQRTPISLIPMEEAERNGDQQLATAKGVVYGNRSDYRMNTSVLHASGTLLLGVDESRFLDDTFRCLPQTTLGAMPQSLGLASPAPAAIANDNFDDDNDLGGGFLGDDDNDDHDVLCSDNEGGDVRMDGAASPAPNAEDDDHVHQHMVQNAARAEPVPLVQLAADPWEMLDPHDPESGGETINRFRKIKSYRVPSSLVAGKKTKQAAPVLAPFSEFCIEAFGTLAGKKSLPRSWTTSLAFPEFAAIYWRERKRRAARHRASLAATGGGLISQAYTHPHDTAKAPPMDNGELASAAVGDDDLLQPDDADDDADNGFDDHGHYSADEDDFESVPTQDGGAAFDFIAAQAASRGSGDQPPMPTTYEDLVRQHLDKYLAEAQQFVHETELTRRVHDWEARIKPVLEQELEHRPFDIHEYGAEILHQLPPKPAGKAGEAGTPVVEFAQAMAGIADASGPACPTWEVCRGFLSTLQLSNNGNLEIVRVEPGPDGCEENFRLRFKSGKQINEELASFRAPSLV